jgi:RNA polymerase sigma-19 factor, ECF subfamily
MTLPLSTSARTVRLEPATTTPAVTPKGAARSRADESEFAALFSKHYASLCDFVNSYVHAPDIAEEVVQAVFLRVWEERAQWNPRNSARAYLFAVCRNLALDWLRHEQIVARVAADATANDGRSGVGQWTTLPSAQVLLEEAEIGDRLKAAVARLPKRRRMVVILRWQHEMKNREIATILGISVKGVEVQFSRALADLRRLLGPRSAEETTQV